MASTRELWVSSLDGLATIDGVTLRFIIQDQQWRLTIFSVAYSVPCKCFIGVFSSNLRICPPLLVLLQDKIRKLKKLATVNVFT